MLWLAVGAFKGHHQISEMTDSCVFYIFLFLILRLEKKSGQVWIVETLVDKSSEITSY